MVGLGMHVSAQSTPSEKSETRKEQNKKWKDELNLTKEQGTELKEINKNFKEKARSIKENTSLSQEQKKEQFSKLNVERKEKLNTILTPEQQQKFNERKKAHYHGKGPKKDRTTK